jgi:hypothetical protein
MLHDLPRGYSRASLLEIFHTNAAIYSYNYGPRVILEFNTGALYSHLLESLCPSICYYAQLCSNLNCGRASNIIIIIYAKNYAGTMCQGLTVKGLWQASYKMFPTSEF